MTYLSVCSGIEAATVAWHDLMEPAAFSEIEPFASAVLAHHYPSVPNLGDMTKYREWNLGSVDLLVGGTPCQSFSVAGLRAGLDDPRGNLMLVYLGVVERVAPRWIVWENVPGVLSSKGGRDFGTFLGALGELGYGWAYRTLDAQFFGVPQRRRRVFVVGYLGDWRPPAAVLFEPHSLSGNPPPSREKGERVALQVTSRVDRGGEHREAHGNNLIARPLRSQSQMAHREDADTLVFDRATITSPGNFSNPQPGDPSHALHTEAPLVAHALTAQHTASGRMDPNGETFVTHSLRADGFDASEDGTGRGTPLVFDWQSGGDVRLNISEKPSALQAHQTPAVLTSSALTSSVRRLTPREHHRYLRSRAWKVLRIAVFVRDGYQCEDCGRKVFDMSKLHCHHKTYERLGRERMTASERGRKGGKARG